MTDAVAAQRCHERVGDLRLPDHLAERLGPVAAVQGGGHQNRLRRASDIGPGAAGNTATEDTVNMLHRMGVATGIDLAKYLEAVALIKANVNAPLPGRFATARNFFEYCFFDPKDAAC